MAKNVLEVKHNNGEKTTEKLIESLEKSSKLIPVEVKSHTYDDANLISEAIRNKTIYIDLKRKKRLAFTQVAVLEISNKDIKAIEMTLKQELEKFEKATKRGFKASDVSTILVKFESVHAAFLESEIIDQTIKRLNKVLADGIKNGSEDDKRNIRNGVVSFFARSKTTISENPRKFKNDEITLNNREEKEYFRNDFIAQMLKDGVVDYSLLVEGGIITALDFMTLDEVFRDLGVLSNEEFENACYLADVFDSRKEILDYYAQKDKRFFASFATLEECVKYLVEGKIDAKSVIKRLKIEEIKKLTPEQLEELLQCSTFTKGIDFIDFVSTKTGTDKVLNSKFLKALDREQFMKIVMSDKIKYKNPLDSNDYIDMYGTLQTEDIEELLNNGFINIEDVIKLTKFKALKTQNPEDHQKMIELQTRTYNFESLKKLLESEKINKRFSELYNDLINNELSKEQKDKYFEELRTRLISNENGEETLILLAKRGITFNGLDYQFSPNKLEDMYLEEQISEQDILNLCEDRLIPIDSLKEIFSSEDLMEHYRNGNVSYKVLNVIDNRAEQIRKELLSGNIKSAELIGLYSNQNGIDIQEFMEIVKDFEFEDEALVDFITDEITPEKVEDLFKNYYISQDELSVLVERKIITLKQAKDFAERIATQEAYDAIFNNNGIIVLTEDTPARESTTKGLRGTGGARTTQLKNDPELQDFLLDQIGFDERRPVLKGTNNSLDGYRIYPSKELELMVFLKNDKPGNATYIMSLQQGMFFLKKMARGASIESKTVESDATKQALRETEHVKVRNASQGWGKNVVLEMKKLSPEFAKRLKGKSEYKLAIDSIIEDIKDDYEKRKNESRIV
ncbi:MAG: hypothetical protein IJW20_04505 [Clostridia bacterium]|nr:hypothetical protein [Clostridia bacterium]